MVRWGFWISILLWTAVQLPAQPAQKQTTEEYVAQFKVIAINEMHRTGIPASIKLAQGILESGSGNSRLAREANNHFGIKCHKGWTGESVYEDDDAPNECFRKYKDPATSYLDHSSFLMTRDRYAFLFDYDKTDYKRWAHGLKKAGYATNPQYAPLLIGLIERYNLHQYDLSGPIEAPSLLADHADGEGENDLLIYPTKKWEVNRADVIYRQHGQTVAQIANSYGIPLRKLEKWNDIDLGYTVAPGMHFFLQPKRNKGATRYHRVDEGETMYGISQQYGIKVDKLYQRNALEMGQEPAAGERIYLRGKRDNPPALRPKLPPPTKVVEQKSTLSEAAQPEKVNEPEPVMPVDTQQTPATYIPVDAVTDTTVVPEVPSTPNTPTTTPTTDPAPPTTPDKPLQPDSYPSAQHQVKDGDTLYAIARQYGITVAELKQWNRLTDNHIQIGQMLLLSEPE